ncbi:MAG: MotA/TolQ/ExbB proton channel family protein [Candidatus Omnitrophota bacterium]
MLYNSKGFRVIFACACMVVVSASMAFAGDADVSEQGMTMWQIIRSGGGIMIVLALLSIAALSLILYYFITIKHDKLLPEDFFGRILSLVKKRKYEEAKSTCESNRNLISDMFSAALSRVTEEKILIKEAIEDEASRAAEMLWQKLGYLADIAAIAPMVGLLGTILGMIQAFNVIAFQTGAVKPILLAGGISKAMVTTAAGLIIAVPSMIFHSFFRGKVQNVIVRLEDISTDMYRSITETAKEEKLFLNYPQEPKNVQKKTRKKVKAMVSPML